MSGRWWFACVAAVAGAIARGQEASSASRPAPPEEAKPPGVTRLAPSEPGPGLAGRYPDDAGIRRDRRVLFVDDFESDPPFITWTERNGELVRTTGEAHGGKQAVAVTCGLADGTTTNWLFKRLPIGQDLVHLRFYVKFPGPAEYVQRFVSLTADAPPRKIPLGGAGVCPDGGARFSTEATPFARKGAVAAPGAWRLSSYWCEMAISDDAKYWGNAFEPETPIPAPKDAWTCVELMVKANSSPFEKDGEQALWIDGREAGRWTGIRWRTNPKLQINGVWLLVHATAENAKLSGSEKPAPHVTVLFDDVVVATEYVGPKVSR